MFKHLKRLISAMLLIALIGTSYLALAPQFEAQSATQTWHGSLVNFRGYKGETYYQATNYYVKVYNDSEQGFRYKLVSGGSERRKYTLTNTSTWEKRHVYCLGAELGFNYKEIFDYQGDINNNDVFNDYFANYLSDIAQKGIALASIYGYRDGINTPVAYANNDDYWLATQTIIWEYQQGIRTNPYSRQDNGQVKANTFYDTIKGKSAEKCYDWILEQIAHHQTVLSFTTNNSNSHYISTKTHTLNETSVGSGVYRTTLYNSTANADRDLVAMDSNGNTIPYITVTRIGSSYTITSTKKIDSSLSVTLVPKTVLTSAPDGIFLTYGSILDNQTMLCGTLRDPMEMYMGLKTQDETPEQFEFELTKQNANGDIAGVEFMLIYHSYVGGYARQVPTILSTDATGKISFSINLGLSAGTMYTGFNSFHLVEMSDMYDSTVQLSSCRVSDKRYFYKNVTEYTQWGIATTYDEALAKSPDGVVYSGYTYTLDDGIYNGASVSTTIENKEKTGNVDIIKTSSSGEVAEFAFRIEGLDTNNNSVNKTVTTDSTGKIAQTLPVGRYRISEILPTGSEWQQPDPQIITIEAGQTTTVDFYNYKSGTLHLRKSSEDNDLSGISFVVKGNGYEQTFTLDEENIYIENGVYYFDINIRDLVTGTYTVTEICADRYQTPQVQTIEVKPNQTTTVTFFNKLKTGGLKIVKTFEGRTTGLEGVPFTIVGVAANGVQVYNQQLTTNAAGEINIASLPMGTHTVTELASELTADYTLSPTQTIIVAAGQLAELEIHNTLKRGGLSVIKTFEDITTPIAGVPFTIVGTYNGVEVYNEKHTTDSTGAISIAGLPIGSYTVTELESELTDDYVLSAAQTVAVAADKVTELTINNLLKRGSLTVIKTFEGRETPLVGVPFEIVGTNANGVEVYRATHETDENGKIVLTGLKPGQYTVTELAIELISSYVLSSKQMLTVAAEKVAEVEIHNEARKGSLTINKVGSQFVDVTVVEGVYTPVFKDAMLSGAVFELRAAEDIVLSDGAKLYNQGDLVRTIQELNGIYKATDLYEGVYELTEVKAPQGYIADGEKLTVTVKADDAANEQGEQVLTIENQLRTVRVNFGKILENGEESEYEKVRFGLYAKEDIQAANGAVIPAGGLIKVMGITYSAEDKCGYADYAIQLPQGEYYIEEIETAEGYILGGDVYSFTVSMTDDVTKYDIKVNEGNAIKNIKIPKNPSTGSDMRVKLAFAAIAVTIAAVITLCCRRESKE